MLAARTGKWASAAIGVAVIAGVAGCGIPLSTFGNGITPVGNGSGQVKPGLYTTNATGDHACSVFRTTSLSPFSHKYNGGRTSWGGGRQFILIRPGDVGVSSEDCAKWVVPQAKSYNPVNTRARAGEYRVGNDLAPGTYTTTGNPKLVCQWFRLGSFDGSEKAVIKQGANFGPVTVTIAPTDVGFDSISCGTWNRVGS